MTIVFTALQRFDPASGDTWHKFIAWSGLTHLREVVSLDAILCPQVFANLTAEDWKHNVHEDFRTHLFHNVEHVIAVVAKRPLNVVALLEEPSEEEISSFADPRFALRGFDLIEDRTEISALVSCRGFDRAFRPSDLSNCGLLVDHAEARRVQHRLRAEYPDEPHAQCRMWAIWQMARRDPALENP